ncbi:MAG TPA: LamG domain-containing protein, partial [Solirubrobacterales bacterium]|nr:LamG domain-containing protein [Solirubrobacterales bacterium]
TIATGQAYHVVGTYDGTTQRLYVNGTQVAQTALSGAISTNNNPLYLGSWDGTAEYFAGTIDDVAVYGSTLSAARVSAHYSAATTSQTTALEGAALQADALPTTVTYSIASAPTIRDYCLLPGAHEDQTAYEPWRNSTL